MHKVILILDKFLLKYEGGSKFDLTPPPLPQEKHPSKSLVLLGFKSATVSKKSIPKYTLPIKSENKALELIKVLQIVYLLYVIKTLPSSLPNRDNIPTLTYKFGGTVRK